MSEPAREIVREELRLRAAIKSLARKLRERADQRMKVQVAELAMRLELVVEPRDGPDPLQVALDQARADAVKPYIDKLNSSAYELNRALERMNEKKAADGVRLQLAYEAVKMTLVGIQSFLTNGTEE